MEWTNKDYFLCDDREKVDIKAVHLLLLDTYWAKTRPVEVVEESVQNSLCFSIFRNEAQVGFGRVITDYATWAVIIDIVIDKEYRGQGLGKWLVQCITEHPQVIGLKQILWTLDADGLYSQFGFATKKEKPIVMFKGLGYA